jgi:beta-glucosidase/6-phospho-beta-glucosidase/beta-galactosidase
LVQKKLILEWHWGYSERFGIHYVEYENGFKRYQKESAKWWSRLLRKYQIVSLQEIILGKTHYF